METQEWLVRQGRAACACGRYHDDTFPCTGRIMRPGTAHGRFCPDDCVADHRVIYGRGA